jgi:hypothetical protein
MDKECGLTDCVSFVVMQERNLTQALTTIEQRRADFPLTRASFIGVNAARIQPAHLTEAIYL